MKRFILLLVSALVITACATSPTGRKQLMLVSPEQAISASKEAYLQTIQPLREKGKVDSNQKTAARIRFITGRIVAQTIALFPHTRQWEWSIKVIDDPETINAWCMAGGKMAIYTGLINKLKVTDDELAQVLAHEVSHAIANHTAEKMSVALASQLGVMGVGLATSGSEHGRAALAGSALAAVVAIQLPNSRSAETEADLMGIELAARAGYNPYAAASLWKKMEEAGGSGPPQFLSTHPAPTNRQATLSRIAPKYMELYQLPGRRPVYQFKD